MDNASTNTEFAVYGLNNELHLLVSVVLTGI
jgi:hypothetical protein